MFKVIANFENTIQHIVFDNTKALTAEKHLCYIFPFFCLGCICSYFRFTSTWNHIAIISTKRYEALPGI